MFFCFFCIYIKFANEVIMFSFVQHNNRQSCLSVPSFAKQQEITINAPTYWCHRKLLKRTSLTKCRLARTTMVPLWIKIAIKSQFIIHCKNDSSLFDTLFSNNRIKQFFIIFSVPTFEMRLWENFIVLCRSFVWLSR